MKWVAVVAALAGVASADSVPEPEVVKAAHVDVPAVPGFQLPSYGDGSHGVRELRVRGMNLMGDKVTVRGYVIWIYDCVGDNHKSGESIADTQKKIDDDPTLCERPKFYLGDAKDTSPDRGLWIVDVPRLPNKLERERLSKKERDELHPADKVPKLAIGDYVTVTGRFVTRSAHGEANSDGLVVFDTLAHVQTMPAPKYDDTAAARVERKHATAAAPKVHESSAAAESRKHSNVATRAFANKKYDEAIAEYRIATDAWHDNHLAWYGLGAAHAFRAEWDEAADAFAAAAQIGSDVAMYQMWYGVATYEKIVAREREDQARHDNKDPKDVHPDLANVNFEVAVVHLEHALELEPNLWRAHYYLGRIRRAQEKAREAAFEFSDAIATNPRESAPYIALSQLYARWEYTDLAISVGLTGTANTSDGQVWLVVGLAYDDKGMQKEAIAAYDKAIAADPADHKAVFQRGQDLFRTGDLVGAKRDLDDFVKSAPGEDFAKQQANLMLMDIAAKKR